MSSTLYDQIQAVRKAYPQSRSAIIPALRLAQEAHGGWLPEEAFREVADALDVTPAYCLSIASFYDMFHTEPVGRHLVEVCTNVSCALSGAQDVVEVHDGQVQHELLVGEAREVEQVVDQARLQFDVSADHRQLAARVRRQVGARRELADGGQRGRERRAQLVAEGGEEAVLGAVGVLELSGAVGAGLPGVQQLLRQRQDVKTRLETDPHRVVHVTHVAGDRHDNDVGPGLAEQLGGIGPDRHPERGGQAGDLGDIATELLWAACNRAHDLAALLQDHPGGERTHRADSVHDHAGTRHDDLPRRRVRVGHAMSRHGVAVWITGR